ncbi:hypothetical protein NMG60_11002282 [Bertholletia excelsa]
MAEEFHTGGGSWWDSSRRPPPPSSDLAGTGGFGWLPEMDLRARSSVDSAAGSSGSAVLSNPQKLHGQDSGASGGVAADLNLQMIGLGLSSQAMDWNPTILHEESPASEYKQINRGISLDQPQFNFQMDTSAYGNTSSQVLHGLLVSENQQETGTFESRPMSYPYHQPGLGMSSGELLQPPWPKIPHQFLRAPPPAKQPPYLTSQFNNAPFWSASIPAMNNAGSSLFPSLPPPQLPPPLPPPFEEKPKQNTSEIRDLGKKSGSETSNKRPRNETSSSSLPAFKVRKEKMGDRITALQQLVSPFGKTDTASVLSEAIEYIKYLHDQVNILSSPYMKSGASMQQLQENSDKSMDPEGPRQDLRSRGLCLVPVSSTFPVTHETAVDFWNPTFGGAFR